MAIARFLKHMVSAGRARRLFPASALDTIQQAIAQGETRHQDQVCFAIEGALPASRVLRGLTPRARAHEVFSHLRVWDTRNNSGVLIYVLVADHAIEIVADRGIAAKVGEAEWVAVCVLMQREFAAGNYEKGSIAAVAAITEILVRHFPAHGGRNRDELPDRPVML